MEFIQPTSWAEALAVKAQWPEAHPIQGGTDVLLRFNFDHDAPDVVLDLGRVPEIRQWSVENGHVTFGAGVTYTQLIAELADELPGLAMAARTVGSPQIRNRGTVGGNLGTASPAGDAHPPLLASAAEVQVASLRGRRTVPIREFFTGLKQTALAEDELIESVRAPRASGGQQFAKVGTRNAMVIAVCSLALEIDPERRRVGTGIGSAGPVPLVADEAEAFLTGVLEETGLWDSPAPLAESAVARFGELVAAAARPIDDVRGRADYRRHALSVMARRTLGWVRAPNAG